MPTTAYNRAAAARQSTNEAVRSAGASIRKFAAIFGDSAVGFVKGPSTEDKLYVTPLSNAEKFAYTTLLVSPVPFRVHKRVLNRMFLDCGPAVTES